MNYSRHLLIFNEQINFFEPFFLRLRQNYLPKMLRRFFLCKNARKNSSEHLFNTPKSLGVSIKRSVFLGFRKHLSVQCYNDEVVLKSAQLLSTQNIADELIDWRLDVRAIWLLGSTTSPTISYLVFFFHETNLVKVHNISEILNFTVRWEKYIRKLGHSQCHRCQRFGHTATYCAMNTKYMKCASDHDTVECPGEN